MSPTRGRRPRGRLGDGPPGGSAYGIQGAAAESFLSHGDGVKGVPESCKLLDEGKLGLYMVYTFEIRVSFTPKELLDPCLWRSDIYEC